MTINVNGVALDRVLVNGTRMERVYINGTQVYEAANGNVTQVFTGGGSGSFSLGAEDLNRHFVLVGTQFSGSGLPLPSTPTVNGSSMSLITYGSSGNFDDGGVTGIYTIKIPTGTGTVSFSAGSFGVVAIYRVTGCSQMTSPVSSGTTNGSLGSNYGSPSNGQGCCFVGTVGNFYNPAVPSPNSSGLGYAGSFGAVSAANSVSANSQYVSTNGNQISSFAIFAYDLY